MKKSLKNLLNQAKPYLKFKYAGPISIILPVFLVLLVNLTIIFLDGRHWNNEYPEFFCLILKSIIQPIFEEVLFRGIILGAIFLFLIPLLINPLLESKIEKNKYYILVIWIFQSIIFTMAHNNPSLINWVIRFSGGLVYGFLYIFYKNNLLPPTLGHITHNLLINLGFYDS